MIFVNSKGEYIESEYHQYMAAWELPVLPPTQLADYIFNCAKLFNELKRNIKK